VHVECDGHDITGTMTVPSTGGWQTWTTITKTVIYLNTINQIIKVYCDGGDFNINSLKFILNDQTGTSSTPEVGDKVKLYPNPANKNITLELPEPGGYLISNLVGKHVQSGKGALINVEGLISGVYFIRVGNNVSKFVKN